MKMNIKKFANLTGVSVRTLHYYDEIDLLKPEFVDSENSYRYYGEKSLFLMQEILFYRELDFSLKAIKEIISSPNYNKNRALSKQKQLLILKKQRLEKIIAAIDSAQKGETVMNFDAFDKTEFEKQREVYAQEAKQRWGNTSAYKEYEQKELQNESAIVNGINAIIKSFSDALKNGISPKADDVICLVKRLQTFITETQYNCTDEILYSLGEMYVSDERFKKNIDKFGEGTAQFISDSIKEYCFGKI